MQTAAYELGIDPAEMRFKNFIQPEQFPYTTPTGFVYDSGDYPTALRKALDEVGYEDAARGAGRRRAPRAGSSASASRTSPRRSARGRRRSTTSSASR